MKTVRAMFFGAMALLVSAPFLSQAREITAEEAATAATTWVNLGYSLDKIAPGRKIASVETLADPDSGAELRVAAFEGGGFVVLSADDRIDPVLAFSDSGDGVAMDEANPLWALLRADISSREAAAGVERGEAGEDGRKASLRGSNSSESAFGDPAAASASRRWAELLGRVVPEGAVVDPEAGTATVSQAGTSSISDIRVDALVQSAWDQEDACGKNCWNYFTPKNYVCGCTATALSQIMRFWQRPTASVSAKSYLCKVDGTETTLTMKGGTYSWSSMPLKPAESGNLTDAQCQAIGKLAYDVAVSLQTSFTSGGGTASILAGMPVLLEDFGYTSAVAIYYSSDTSCAYSLSTFQQHVCPSLDAGCPVGMSVPGHAVVCDGYGYSGSDFYIHVNYGWGVWRSDCNVWYCPPALSAGGYVFNAINGVLSNVSPTKTGNILSGRVVDSSGKPVSGATVTLKSGSTTVASATTNAKGVYAVWAAAGSYTVQAAKDGVTVSRSGTIGTTSPLSVIDHGTSFWLRPCSLGNSWGNNLTLNVSTATAPAAPTGVSATDGTSTANCTVSWSASSGATSYTVYRYTSNASGSASTLKTGVSGTSYIDTSATPGTLYYYWVKAVNGAGSSGFSGSDSGYRKLAAPTISSATGSTSGVALSWSASTGATHYRVFRATSSSGTKTALGSWQTGRTFTDTSGTAGTTYYYFVQAAMNSSGTRPSDYSAYKTGVKTKVTAPSAPTGVTAADGASTANCTVSWGAVSGATSYTVYRHTSNSSGSATTLKTGVTGTSYADTTATPGTLFYYWVKAVNSAGTSGFSGSDSGYRKLSAPTISAATGSTTGVALSWGSSTGATHYRVYRATSSTGTKTALGSWQTGCTYTDTSGAAGTTYYYFVQAAMNASGTRPSDYSASKTGAKMALPSAVSTVSASDGTSTASVSLSWSAVSGAATYMVYRSPQGAGSDKAVVVTSGISSTSYADSNVTPGVRYDYWVRAVNSVGIGNFGGMDSGWRKIPNDAFASAVALSGYSGAVEWGTLGATAQSGEPLHADVSNNSAWWTWTAPAKGTVEISTVGSAFDTVLGVYTGTAVGSLTKVAANDDSGGASTSRVVFDTAGAGTVYRIAVAGYDGSAGPLELSWNFEALNAATFTDMSLNASTGVAHVSFKARKGMSYRIQRASSLGGSWTTVKTITPSATGTVAADISLPTSWSSGFVRVVVDE